jgi:zinc transporter ZupT
VTIINNAKRFAHRRNARMLAPPLTFAAGVLAASVCLAISTIMLPANLAFAFSAALLFVIAASVALFALSRRRSREGSEVTYWDVAGALILLGICAAALVDPDQFVPLVQGTHPDK